jgi:hypothetical protein
MSIYVNTILFLLLAFALLTSLACKESLVVNAPVESKSSITGVWDWVETGYWPIYTPASTGDSVAMVFTADSVFSLFVNGVLDLHGPFTIIRDTYPPYATDTTEILVINWSPERGGRYYGISVNRNDTLELKPYVTDAAEYMRYVRRKTM